MTDTEDDKLIEVMARAACEADGRDPDEVATYRGEQVRCWVTYEQVARGHIAMQRVYEAHEALVEFADPAPEDMAWAEKEYSDEMKRLEASEHKARQAHEECERRNAELRAERDRMREALRDIRGWREIDVSSDERHLPGQLSAIIERIEQICDAALGEGESE
jgi:predicted  nucleic acid-binding Zn-ribbon protein